MEILTRKRYLFLSVFFVIVFSLAWNWQYPLLTEKNNFNRESYATIGNPVALSQAYQQWKSQEIYNNKQGQLFRLPLTFIKGVSSGRGNENFKAQGVAKINLLSGEMEVDVSSLPGNKAYAVWLLDETDQGVYVGSLRETGNKHILHTTLSAVDLTDFSLSKIMISAKNSSVENGSVEKKSTKKVVNLNQGILFGSPTLFQRLYYEEVRLNKRVKSVPLENKKSDLVSLPLPFSFLIPSPAYAATETTNLSGLVAAGEDLFFNETFNGNGRTCGTCHPAENNFTIDPEFIATLPANDPLFVAEFNSDLEKLENPALMRDFGLILANVDGFDDPETKFVMRGVSHTLGLSMTIQSSATQAPFQNTGWSGDGAPGGGTLRDFSTGAVVQHFTKTLDRQIDEDFRLPTAAELDALEAFMLSLGRQSDPDLNAIQLIDRNAERGRVLFLAEDSENRTVQAAKCNICHRNAGALTLAGVNSNFITGTENMLHPAGANDDFRPRDGGFGKNLNAATGGFGDANFNTASLWEAADTAPFFHHNGATTLEEAIAFYDSNAFKNSVEGQRLLLMDSGGQELSVEVDALAAFLRVINVIENIRSSRDYLMRAQGENFISSNKLLTLAIADINDILNVLTEGELHENAAVIFDEAKSLSFAAREITDDMTRDAKINEVLSKLTLAKSMIVDVTAVVDAVIPNVTIISPSVNDVLAGVNTIVVDATDNEAIATVIMLAGKTEIGRLSAAPFSFLWDTTAFADGITNLTAIAIDVNGNRAQTSVEVDLLNLLSSLPSASVSPTVDAMPTLSIVSPSEGARVAGTVTIMADAQDDIGVQGVRFMINASLNASSELLGESLTPSAQGFYELNWDTTQFSEGAQTIVAEVTDSSNNVVRVSVNVTVDNVLEEVCTVYSCALPRPPATEPPPVQIMPVGSSPDGEFDGVLTAVNLITHTITIDSGGDSFIVTLSSNTEFMGSIAASIDDLLIGHVVQGEFFSSTNEVVWIEADLPPGL